MKKHVKLKISGKVQGVWYRASTELKAKELGIAGFVKNQPDGSVYAEAEGSEAQIEALVRWCKSGSPLARVASVIVEEGTLCHFEGFEVRRG